MPYPIKLKNAKIGVLALNPISQETMISKETVTPNDILPGRGKNAYLHYGNRIFLSLIKQYDNRFFNSPNSLRKKYVEEIHTLLSQLDPPARFLKPCKKVERKDQWEEMSSNEALTKIRQAIRDNKRRKNRETVSSTLISFDRRTLGSKSLSKNHSRIEGNEDFTSTQLAENEAFKFLYNIKERSLEIERSILLDIQKKRELCVHNSVSKLNIHCPRRILAHINLDPNKY